MPSPHTRCAGFVLLALLLSGGPAVARCPTEGLDPVAAITGSEAGLDEGMPVRVRGIVTGDFRGEDAMRGFFLQSRRRGDDGLPHATFVFAPGLEAGDGFGTGSEVLVEGRVTEYRGRRQIGRVATAQECARPGLPEPAVLPFPDAERDRWPRYRDLLVTVDEPMTVTGNFELARYGTLPLSSGGRLFRPTQFDAPAEVPNAARRLLLDDGSYRQFPDPVPYLDSDGTRRVGSVIERPAGVLTHAFGDWRLHPPDPGAVTFVDANPRPAPPPRTAGTGRIAGFNVENYFLTLGERGAADAGELAAQRGRLEAVASGLRADLLGLVEVENDPRAVDDLASRLGRAAGIEGGYAHFDRDEPVGTDAIRVALAWNPAAVEVLDGPFIDDDRVHHRPPVAGHFRFDPDGPGKIVVVIHHKAKVGCPETGDIDRGQGCWNERRTEQSRALRDFLDALRERTGTERVLVIGDINAYAAEDPVNVLRSGGLRDLLRRHVPHDTRYTYVFRGESGNLDVALASDTLAGDVVDARPWPVNADEPAALHSFSDVTGPWRASDHDPVFVDIGVHGE